jgi:hydroxyacid-oxoacid transhydrogenase
VIVTAAAAFRFTYEAAPERHHRVAELLADVPALVEGPLAQQRLLAVAPRPAAAEDLAAILRASL